MRCVLVFSLFAMLAAVAGGQPAPPDGSKWGFDELTLKNGAKFQGLILKELPDGIEFQSVMRNSGRPTVTLTSFFAKSEIASTKKLSDKRIAKPLKEETRGT